MVSVHTNLARAAATNLVRNPRGPLAAALGLFTAVTLLVAGLALAEGLAAESRDAVEEGAGVYCTYDVFGRDAAVPVEVVSTLRGLAGVERVVPRVVGRVTLDGRVATVLGVPLAELARAAEHLGPSLEGQLPRSAEEVLVGRDLARELGLRVGGTIALDATLLRLFTVAGIVDSTAALWSARAVVCELNEAQLVFGEARHVSDVCLDVRDGAEALVAEAAQRLDRRLRVQTRSLVRQYTARGHALRGGTFAALLAVALALTIPTFGVLAHLGAAPRRRELGLLKAEGWSTGEVLEMVALESLWLGLAVGLAAFLAGYVWVRVLGAPLLAGFFVPELGAFPRLELPARFTPLPLAAALVCSVAVTTTGSLVTTWRTARTRPVEVLR